MLILRKKIILRKKKERKKKKKGLTGNTLYCVLSEKMEEGKIETEIEKAAKELAEFPNILLLTWIRTGIMTPTKRMKYRK